MYRAHVTGAQVNSFVGAFYDSVILYATALQETIEANGSETDGRNVTLRMWNRTIEGITGNLSIDDNGDRNADYSLLDMNPHTGYFEVSSRTRPDRTGPDLSHPIPSHSLSGDEFPVPYCATATTLQYCAHTVLYGNSRCCRFCAALHCCAPRRAGRVFVHGLYFYVSMPRPQ